MRGITVSHLERYGAYRQEDPPEAWMMLKDPEHLQILLEKSGFQEGQVVRKSTGYALQAAEDWWGFVWGNGRWQKELRRLPSESLERLRTEIINEIRGLRTSEGIWLDASALIGIGTRE